MINTTWTSLQGVGDSGHDDRVGLPFGVSGSLVEMLLFESRALSLVRMSQQFRRIAGLEQGYISLTPREELPFWEVQSTAWPGRVPDRAGTAFAPRHQQPDVPVLPDADSLAEIDHDSQPRRFYCISKTAGM